MLALTGFFGTAPKQETASSFINTGNEPFHALAVALIDRIKSSARLNDSSMKKILERFYTHYPKYITNQPYLTTAERMSMLLKNSRPSEIVECMAYVLRQLAVDEIYTQPLNYREIFNDLSPQTSKEYIRLSTTILPLNTLSALTSLGITINCSFTEHGKELRKKEIYSDHSVNNPKFEVSIQIQGEHYFALVKNKTDFAYVGHLAINPPKPVENPSIASGNIADILDVILLDNKRLMESYEHQRKILLSMAAAGELTMQHLISLYIKFLPTSTTSLARNAQFFFQLAQLEKTPILFGSSGNSEQQTIKLLAESLARWVSTGLIDQDELFEHLENKLMTAAH